MGWSKNYSTLSRHRKLYDLAGVLGCDRFKAIGLLVAVHNFAVEFEPDGNLSAYTDESLATQIGWKSRRVGIKSALTRVGLVDDSGVIHDWPDYQGSYREAEKKRRQREQAQKEVPSRDRPGTVPARGEERRREEKRGEEFRSIRAWKTSKRNEFRSQIFTVCFGQRSVPFPSVAKDAARDSKLAWRVMEIVESMNLTVDELKACVRYHEEYTTNSGSGGYLQTWPGFAAKVDGIATLLRKGPGKTPRQMRSESSDWLNRKMAAKEGKND